LAVDIDGDLKPLKVVAAAVADAHGHGVAAGGAPVERGDELKRGVVGGAAQAEAIDGAGVVAGGVEVVAQAGGGAAAAVPPGGDGAVAVAAVGVVAGGVSAEEVADHAPAVVVQARAARPALGGAEVPGHRPVALAVEGL